MAQQETVGKGVRKSRRGSIAGFRNRLSVKEDLDHDNFAYRIVNDYDDGDRIGRFLDNDWEIVMRSERIVGDKDAKRPSPEGTPVKISVGQGTQAYLMRKPKEWHEADQAVKQAEIDAHEAGMQPSDTYGSIKIDKSEIKR